MIELTKENGNGFRFRITSESGHLLLNSILFSDEHKAKNSARELPKIIAAQNVFERKTNHEGKFLFNLKNTNGVIIGQSQLYSSEAGMENGIKNLKNRIATIDTLKEL